MELLGVSAIWAAVVGGLAYAMLKERQAWTVERQALLDRVQASSLAEYKHLQSTRQPKTVNPMKHMFAEQDLLPREEDRT